MKINHQLFFSFTEEASLEVRPKIVRPTEAAALAATTEPGELRNSPPTALAVGKNEVDELLVLLSRPRPFLYPELVAAWLSPHITEHYYYKQHQNRTRKTLLVMTQKPHPPLYKRLNFPRENYIEMNTLKTLVDSERQRDRRDHHWVVKTT